MTERRLPRLCLASRSPRRAEYLRLLGAEFEQFDSDVDESRRADETPLAYVERIASWKAEAAHKLVASCTVFLAADTTVCIDDEIFGKPSDRREAQRMLEALSGRCHQVHTAVRIESADGLSESRTVSSTVEFVDLERAVIDAYWASGEPADKAGAYAIQGLGGAFVRRIEGSCSAVVGLPLAETADLLRLAGVPLRLDNPAADSA